MNHFYLVLIAAALIVAAINDLRTRRIPPLIPIAILALAPMNLNWSWPSAVGGAMVGGGILLLADMIHAGAFGGGDIKLLAACGWALGYSVSLLGIFLAIVFSFFPCIYQQFLKKAQTHLAFAPYIAAGYILAVIFLI